MLYIHKGILAEIRVLEEGAEIKISVPHIPGTIILSSYNKIFMFNLVSRSISGWNKNAETHEFLTREF